MPYQFIPNETSSVAINGINHDGLPIGALWWWERARATTTVGARPRYDHKDLTARANLKRRSSPAA